MNPVRSDFYIPATCASLYTFERERRGEEGREGKREIKKGGRERDERKRERG